MNTPRIPHTTPPAAACDAAAGTGAAAIRQRHSLAAPALDIQGGASGPDAVARRGDQCEIAAPGLGDWKPDMETACALFAEQAASIVQDLPTVRHGFRMGYMAALQRELKRERERMEITQ